MAIWNKWLAKRRRKRLLAAFHERQRQLETLEKTAGEDDESRFFITEAAVSLALSLPVPDYTYRVGTQMVFAVYVPSFSQWQVLVNDMKQAMKLRQELQAPLWRQLGKRQRISFDDYLDDEGRYASAEGNTKDVLGAFRIALVGELRTLLDALRVTKDADDPGRRHYYMTRVEVLLRDGETLLRSLTSKAMEHLYDHEPK